MTPEEITRRVVTGLEAGQLSRREAEINLGFVLLQAAFIGDYTRPELDSPIATFYRRCSALKDLGLLRESGAVAPVDVDW